MRGMSRQVNQTKRLSQQQIVEISDSQSTNNINHATNPISSTHHILYLGLIPARMSSHSKDIVKLLFKFNVTQVLYAINIQIHHVIFIQPCHYVTETLCPVLNSFDMRIYVQSGLSEAERIVSIYFLSDLTDVSDLISSYSKQMVGKISKKHRDLMRIFG